MYKKIKTIYDSDGRIITQALINWKCGFVELGCEKVPEILAEYHDTINNDIFLCGYCKEHSREMETLEIYQIISEISKIPDEILVLQIIKS